MFYSIQPKTIALCLGVLLMIFVLNYLVLAWTEPSSNPPAGNVPAPLNVGNTGQSKAGGLILNTGGAATGLVVDKGNVGIGTTTPTEKLDVTGSIHASEDVCIGSGASRKCLSQLCPTTCTTTCIGDCSTIKADGTCVAKAAGEYNLPACQRCDGSSLTHVNVTNNTQDTEGSNLCNTTCKKCSSGSCVNQGAEDLFSQCGTTSCYNDLCGNGTGACGYYTSGTGNCSTCQTCVGATSASCVQVTGYNEGLNCTTVCTGCSSGSCVPIPIAQQDTYGSNTCTAEHYRCDGAGACTAPLLSQWCDPWPNAYPCTVECSNNAATCVSGCYPGSGCRACVTCAGTYGGDDCICAKYKY